jgi:DNA-directed RNA polymerase subunit RPC12/RpoP
MSQYDDRSEKIRKIKIGIALVLFLVAGGVAAWQLLKGSPADFANDRGYKCSACDHAYAYVVKSGDIEPLMCPSCGKKAAYQAEFCYWTKGPDGEYVAKSEPTLVLLKRRMNPDSNEPTYCPDCGHEVVGHNPRPDDAMMLEAANREVSD